MPMWLPRSSPVARVAPAAAGPWWPHRPVGRGLMTVAIVLLAGPARLLDAAAPAAAGGWVAWHAISTAAFAALALWALWTPQLPRDAGQAVARSVSLLVLAALCVAAQEARLPDARALGTSLAVLTALAASLFVVGARWARREIDW